ncbi:MAG: hypothetical protein Q4G28_03265 [Neisseria sp.]|nr:hypothetical protein [Neisseria sp.]
MGFAHVTHQTGYMLRFQTACIVSRAEPTLRLDEYCGRQNPQGFVIPAQAGIQKPDISTMFSRFLKPDDWIPACAGMTKIWRFSVCGGTYISEKQDYFKYLSQTAINIKKAV